MRRIWFISLARRSVPFALLWLLLLPDQPASWLVGGPVVVLAAALSLSLSPNAALPIAWLGVPRFAAYLLWEMLRGVWVTSRLILIDLLQGERRRLNPGLIELPLLLQGDQARILLINALNLVPGTLCLSLEAGVVTLHVLDLDGPVAAEGVRLQAEIGRLLPGTFTQVAT